MTTVNQEALVVVGSDRGLTLIPVPTPLTRLNYFDGKFLRADDLRAEQDYLRRLTWIANQGLGSGVVFGFDTTLGGGDSLVLGPGLAIDGRGRELVLPSGHSFGIQELVDASAAPTSTPALNGNGTSTATFSDCVVDTAPPGASVVNGDAIWIVTIGFAEALCGEEDVYGRLCEDACATATDRPLRIEGIVVRAVPLRLVTPLHASGAVALDDRHTRSLVASAYFADEWQRGHSLISGDGLRSEAWCLGSHPDLGGDVPVAVVARSGGSTRWLDPWIARRERMEAPARRYWAGRMAMRAWDAYLAQILQFQCQLHELIAAQPDPGVAPDPCAPSRAVLREAATALESLQTTTAAAASADVVQPELRAVALDPSRFVALRDKIRVTLAHAPQDDGRSRILIGGGIVELPPAGYLPVSPGAVPVNVQVRRLLGEGLDYRFCVVRPDFPAHALESVQHMERISLLDGLDHPDAKPHVDILVPDGTIAPATTPPQGIGFDTRVALRSVIAFGDRAQTGLIVHGAGRADTSGAQGPLFAFAGSTEVATTGAPAAETMYVAPTVLRDQAFVNTISTPETANAVREKEAVVAAASAQTPQAQSSFWVSLHCDRNVLTLGAGDTATVRAFADAAVATAGGPGEGIETQTFGQLRVVSAEEVSGGGRRIVATLTVVANRQMHTSDGQTTSGGGHVVLDVEIVTSLAGTRPPGIVIRLRQHDQTQTDRSPTTFVIAGSWQGDPLEAQFTLGVETNAGLQMVAALSTAARTPVAAALLRENADVLVQGNAVHARALDALAAIASAISDDTFADSATAELFPPPPASTGEATVNATLDWVLFHRRREKQCSGSATPPPPPPPPKVTSEVVYRIDPHEIERVRGFLDNGDVLGAIAFNDPRLLTLVGPADFREGSTDLATAPQTLTQQWSDAGGGTPATALVVTKQDDPDAAETALAPARALTIVAALGGSASADVQQFRAAELPPGAEAVTLILPAELCHHVYAVDTRRSANQLGELENTNDIVTFLGSAGAVDLGELEFEPGTANVKAGSSLGETVENAGLGTILTSIVTYTRPGDPATSEPLETQARTAAMLAGAVAPVILTHVVPPPPFTQRVGATSVGWPDCPFVTLVIVTAPPNVDG